MTRTATTTRSAEGDQRLCAGPRRGTHLTDVRVRTGTIRSRDRAVKKKRNKVITKKTVARGQRTLSLSPRQSVTLTMLTMIGATAFDSKSMLSSEVRKKFAEKFGVDISDKDIADVVSITKSLLTGDEDVVVDDE